MCCKVTGSSDLRRVFRMICFVTAVTPPATQYITSAFQYITKIFSCYSILNNFCSRDTKNQRTARQEAVDTHRLCCLFYQVGGAFWSGFLLLCAASGVIPPCRVVLIVKMTRPRSIIDMLLQFLRSINVPRRTSTTLRL